MLKRTKKENDSTAFEQEPLKPAPPVNSSPSAAKTIIGKQITIEGGLQGEEDLIIEGTLKGSIDLGKHLLTIGPNGKVESEIRAENVTISGKLKGNITALDKVKITKDAAFTGEIHSKRISVEDGAYIKAVIEVERETPKKVESIEKAVGSSLPTSAKEPIPIAGENEKRK
jgi:cytoskeletal protein CcmA (bactofilin family)